MNSIPPREAIETRKSIRTFQEEPLHSVDLEKITNYLIRTEDFIGPFGNQYKFELLIESEERKKDQIGTYGFIKKIHRDIFLAVVLSKRNLFSTMHLFLRI